MTPRRARLAVIAGVLLSLTTSASAQRVADRLDDLRLATAVRLALVDDARTRALDLNVTARDGGVEVSGDVPAADRQTVADVARAVPGVRVLGGLGAVTDRMAPTPTQPRSADRPRGEETTDSNRPPAPTASPSGTAPASGALYHTVERGDTLFSLARRYGTSVEAIQALNDRQSEGIRVGQRLRVR